MGKVGREPKLGHRDLERLERILLQGPYVYGYETELWTLKLIADVIKKEFHVDYHPSHVWKILGNMGWSCQRPERRAMERDEEAIPKWVDEQWPRIKKSREAGRPRRIP